MRVAVGADHAGFPFKAPVIEALGRDGHEMLDLGTSSTAPVDYPDYAAAVGTAVLDGRAEAGILICGSGAGVAIAANKLRGIRAALCHDAFTARQSREDDDANVLCLGARVVDVEAAIALARQFLGARFSGEERHVRRVAKIAALEAREPARAEAAGAAAGEPLDTPAVAAALEGLDRAGAAERLWARDASLWSADAGGRAAIRARLGWLGAPEAAREQLPDLLAFAEGVRRDRIADVVLLGMGGSSLAAEVLAGAFGPATGSPTLSVLDTTDPGAIRQLLGRLKLRETLFLVSSKSGTTVEMLTLYRVFRAELERETDRPGAHFVAITDPGTPLERLAREGGFRRVFLNDPDIGGRFSALSLFGLVPGALAGVDIGRLLDRARGMAEECRVGRAAENPGLRLGATLGALAAEGRDKLTLVVSEPVQQLGAWLEQLLTESTGKHGRGIVVVHGEPLGTPAAYGADRVFAAITLAGDESLEPRLAALQAAGVPVIRFRLSDRLDLGREFFRWEVATAIAGMLLGVNPFDEPNVSEAKAATNAALARFKETGQLPEWPVDSVEEAAGILARARPGDYVALLAYTTPDPRVTAALQTLRTLVRDRTRLATTIGYGPRYLHSTGQLHKGGPPTPILFLFLGEDAEDLPIPGEKYGFATLKTAQALGDMTTLRAAHRRALWLPLAGPVPVALDRLSAALGRLLP
jgi:glucose-6-phosphate isomerase/transaldolase/glucose-6-phosphate isomerase